MQVNPIVSIVMSVYNAEKHLSLAIESILNQSFSNFELIIIEDCSTDESLSIIKKYQAKDSRVFVIKKDKNKGFKGFVENLNLGIETARGIYIARMDADDISNIDRLKNQVEYLDNHPECFLVGSSAVHIDENGKKIGAFLSETNDKKLMNLLKKRNTIYHPTIMFRKELGLHYRDKMNGCEDYDFYLRLLSKDKIFHNLGEPLLQYRILDNSISRKDNYFVKWMFVEKAKEFYYQRKSTGKDLYHQFDEQELKQFFEIENPSSENIILGLKTAISLQDIDYLKQLSHKFSTLYPSYKESKKYALFSKFPIFILKIINKIS